MKNAWLIVDKGKIGSQNQCIGLAEAMHIPYTLKSIHVKFPWYYLPRDFWPSPNVCVENGEKLFAPPYPEIIIASGRSAAQIAASIKKKNPQIFTIYLMDPRMDHKYFDYIVAPAHDVLKGPKVIESMGMLNRVTPALLEQDEAHFKETFDDLPGEKIAVLIGGKSKHYKMTAYDMRKLGESLQTCYSNSPIALMVTFSRRSTHEQRDAFLKAIEGIPSYIWDDLPPNPYFAMLNAADYVLVTQDTTSMVTEACATGKPVFVVELPGHSEKFNRFYNLLKVRGTIDYFKGHFYHFPYQPLQETKRIAVLLNKLWAVFKEKGAA